MPATRQPLPGWAMLVTGLMIGLFVAFLVYLNKRPPAEHTIGAAIDEVKQRTEQFKQDYQSEDKPKFDFYTILPEFEVPVPELELEAKRSADAHTPAEQTAYIVQVASFKQRSEAESLKARLALEYGLQATIQSVTVNDTDTWHRVRVGPFSDVRKVDKVRNQLRNENLQPMVLKLKG